MGNVWEIVERYPLILYKIYASYIDYPTYVSSQLYDILREMERIAYPTRENDYMRSYEYFMLPVKVREQIKYVPIGLHYLKEFDIYHVEILTKGIIEIKREGNERQTHYPSKYMKLTGDVISLVYRIYEFAKSQKERQIYIGLHDMYKSYITGTVKLKYVTEPKITKSEAREILEAYRKNLKNKLPSDEITLRQYLEVARLVYSALGYNVDEDLKKTYKAYADGRDCGMMKLPLDDSSAFKNWLEKEAYCGGHPFEVIAGGNTTYGISLYPPEDGRFILSPGDMIEEYYVVIKEFLRQKVPFISWRLFDALKVLTGEAEVRVNEMNYFPRIIVYYYDVKRKDKIEWDGIEEVEYRRKEVLSK